MIVIKLKKDTKSEMIRSVSREIHSSLSKIIPPFNPKTDEIKLSKFSQDSSWVKLTYEIIRNVRRSKNQENLSPYREMGITMQVGRNS